jgi:hypothetical protein
VVAPAAPEEVPVQAPLVPVLGLLSEAATAAMRAATVRVAMAVGSQTGRALWRLDLAVLAGLSLLALRPPLAHRMSR